MSYNFYFPCFIAVLWCLSVGWLPAQEGQYDAINGERLPAASFDFEWVEELFQEDSLLHIELQTDFEQLTGQKDNPEYQSGIIVFHHNEERFTRMNIRLKARGNSRRKACSFPPIKLDFSHQGTGLEAMKVLDELKLVTHCLEGAAYEQFVFREYITYKLFNLLTPLSFRVRLAKITYTGPGAENKQQHYAFLIEEMDQLARRNGGEEVDVGKVRPKEVDQEQLSMVSVFQFMIANLDWSVTGLHNVKLMQQDGALYPVPYDFDFAGIVGAFYASGKEPPDMPAAPVNRIYQGYCLSQGAFDRVLDQYRKQRESMLDLVADFDRLAQEERTEIIDLLESFFRIIENPGLRETYFIRNCRE